MSLPSQAQDDDSEWEYEYDASETESFYVTVDVSSAAQQIRATKKHGPPLHVSSQPQGYSGQDSSGATLPIDPALQSLNTTKQPTFVDPQDRIQVLDLHTKNPLISYNGKIYSCTWGSTIGTDVFLASSTSLANDNETITPILSFPNVSIIGTSCINLMAKPTTITPRNDAPQPQPAPTGSLTNPSKPIALIEDNSPLPPVPTSPQHFPTRDTHPYQRPFKIPLSPTAANDRRAQTSFLESLINIKAAKGETDQVTVHSTKSNQGTGWRVQRRLAEEAAELDGDGDEDEDEDEDVEAMNLNYPDPQKMQLGVTPQLAATTETQTSPVTPSPTKRGRYGPRGPYGPRGSTPRRIGRPRGGRTRKGQGAGGLFRDYVPSVGDPMGADIRAGGGDSTPSRWEDVERTTVGPVEGEDRGRDDVAGAGAGALESGGMGREGEDDGDVRMEDV
ncbi:MAG: hypothetical protein Q9166_006157 [cf. Caloplaca sp. 2 TL-2023]